MAKTKRDPVREERIRNEAVVDAYGPEEQAMGWYYYLENKIRFPFQARCTVTKAVSPLRKGETVEVRRGILMHVGRKLGPHAPPLGVNQTLLSHSLNRFLDASVSLAKILSKKFGHLLWIVQVHVR